MRVTDKELKQYLKSISDLLLCKPKKRKQFMSDFSNSIDDFLQNNPDASINDLEKALGTPQEIAEEFMADVSPKDVKKRVSIARIAIIPITLGVLIIVFVKSTVCPKSSISSKFSSAAFTFITASPCHELLTGFLPEI